MTPGARQPKWDMYEAVILLDGYLEVLQANRPKARIVKRVSTDLRRMAVNRSIEIDDIYRNVNGISYQIQSMESAYKGEMSGLMLSLERLTIMPPVTKPKKKNSLCLLDCYHLWKSVLI